MISDTPASRPPSESPRPAYPPFETLMYRALLLRCPRCGRGKLYRGLFHMNERCPACGLLIDRKRGYYLGSMYVNYGFTAWATTIAFGVGRIVFNIPGQVLIWPLAAFCLLFPTLFFRHARAFWLALDCQFDRSVLDAGRDGHHEEQQ